MKDFLEKRLSLVAWAILTLGMWLIVVFEARDVGFTGMQWIWLFIIIALVSGLCIWIINIGDDDES